MSVIYKDLKSIVGELQTSSKKYLFLVSQKLYAALLEASDTRLNVHVVPWGIPIQVIHILPTEDKDGVEIHGMLMTNAKITHLFTMNGKHGNAEDSDL